MIQTEAPYFSVVKPRSAQQTKTTKKSPGIPNTVRFPRFDAVIQITRAQRAASNIMLRKRRVQENRRIEVQERRTACRLINGFFGR
jgi:predicted ATPase